MYGRARPLAGLIPTSGAPESDTLQPYEMSAPRATMLWHDAGGATRTLRIAAETKYVDTARAVGSDITTALGVETTVTVLGDEDAHNMRRALAERRTSGWEVLIWAQSPQAIDGPPLELHRAFVGNPVNIARGRSCRNSIGSTRVSSRRRTNSRPRRSRRPSMSSSTTRRSRSFSTRRSRSTLNRHVTYVPYPTTFELADCEVAGGHWSRRRA